MSVSTGLKSRFNSSDFVGVELSQFWWLIKQEPTVAVPGSALPAFQEYSGVISDCVCVCVWCVEKEQLQEKPKTWNIYNTPEELHCRNQLVLAFGGLYTCVSQKIPVLVVCFPWEMSFSSHSSICWGCSVGRVLPHQLLGGLLPDPSLEKSWKRARNSPGAVPRLFCAPVDEELSVWCASPSSWQQELFYSHTPCSAHN